MKISRQLLLAALSGALVCISFPARFGDLHLPELGFLGWAALVPLFFAVRRASPRRAFLVTFVSAAVWYSSSLFWLYRAMNTYGHLPASTSVLVLVLLVVIISAYIALAPMFARLIESRWRGEFLVLLPAAWTAMEIFRNYFPANGFPWSNVAVSQWRFLYAIQISDVVGMYGVTFLVVWVNAFLAECAAKLAGQEVSRFAQKAAVTALLAAVTLSYGFYRMGEVIEGLAGRPSVSVGMVQGNIDQEEKWSKGAAQANLEAHRQGAKKLLESGVEMIIWPEASFPWPIETTDTEVDPRALGMPEEGAVALPYTLLGAVAKTPEGNYHNSAFLFDGEGKIAGSYHKAHLVPFGEYVPYSKLLFFARKLTEPVGNFVAGESYAPLSAGGRKVGVLVCYEDVFPEIARRETAAGAEFLANLTNDAWYGRSSAPYQHLAISVFRSVENRRFMVRATNSGVSAVVLPTGATTVESPIFSRALVASPVALMDVITPYTKLGDWFAWACAVYLAVGLAAVAALRIKRRKG